LPYLAYKTGFKFKYNGSNSYNDMFAVNNGTLDRRYNSCNLYNGSYEVDLCTRKRHCYYISSNKTLL